VPFQIGARNSPTFLTESRKPLLKLVVMQHLDASTQGKQGYPSLNNDIYL